jgi:hypothetical protein
MAGRGGQGSGGVSPFSQRLGESDSRVVWPQASDLECNSQANSEAIHAPEIDLFAAKSLQSLGGSWLRPSFSPKEIVGIGERAMSIVSARQVGAAAEAERSGIGCTDFLQ